VKDFFYLKVSTQNARFEGEKTKQKQNKAKFCLVSFFSLSKLPLEIIFSPQIKVNARSLVSSIRGSESAASTYFLFFCLSEYFHLFRVSKLSLPATTVWPDKFWKATKMFQISPDRVTLTFTKRTFSLGIIFHVFYIMY
jgi:hypothetical protein